MGVRIARKRKPQKQLKIGKRTAKNAFEYQTWQRLCELVGPNKVEYESEKFDYTTSHTYLPDFLVKTKSGKLVYIETKGNGRAFDHSVRTKMINVRDQNPDIDFRILFYSDGKIGPKRKDGSFMKQSDWATKHNFTFAIKNIPVEWFD